MKCHSKAIISTLIFILFCSMVSLYSSEKQPDVADLKNELGSLTGKKKADQLNLLAKRILSTSPEESLTFAQQALKLSGQLKYTLGEGRAYTGLASYYSHKKKYNQALEYYKKALAVFVELDSPKNIGASQANIGQVYRSMHQHKEALLYHQQSLETYKKTGDEALIAWSLFHVGNDYENIEKHDEAIDHYNRSMALMKKLDHKEGAANVLSNMGYTYLNTGEYGQSLKMYREALGLFKETGNREYSALCLSNIGVIYDETGKHSDAIDSYLQSLRLYEELGDQTGVSMVLNNIGIIYKNMDKNKEALEYYQKAVVIEEKHGSPLNVSLMYNNIGTIYKNLKNYDRALENYQKALKLVEELNHKRGISHTYSNIGVLLTKKKDFPGSMEYLRKALKINREIGNKKSVAANLYNIGAGYLDQNQLQQAASNLNQALAMAKTMEAKDLVRECYDSLSTLFSKQKNYKKGLEYYKLWVKTKDEIINQDTSTRIAEMKTRYETEKKEQRIALLEKDNLLLTKNSEIQALTLSKERFKTNAFIFGFLLVIIIILLLFKRYLHLFAFWKKKNYIGHYKIVDQIGAGGMGVIYKAVDLMKKSDPVAIKVIREEFSKDEFQRKRFLNEALLVDQLNHPNIVHVYERSEHNQQLYIAMEMLDGPSLAQLIEKGEHLRIRDCLVIMNQLILTIHRIHAKGIIHRDLKPDNIIVIDKDGNKNFVKLLDFGLARGQNLSSLTGTGEIIGTINYLPPEQISSQEFTTAGDVYSLGVVFYELVTLEKPFIGEFPVDIIKQILDKDPIQPIKLRPELSPRIDRLITQMLEKHPDQRPSEQEILKILEESLLEEAA